MKKLTNHELLALIAKHLGRPIELLKALDGFYQCPKDNNTGIRSGPLVGYAGKYDDGNGNQKQWVGEVYCNFSVAEQYPAIMKHFAVKLAQNVRGTARDILNDTEDNVTELITNDFIVVGPQMGGVAIGMFLALELGCRFAYVEKKITQLASATAREESSLEFVRHNVQKDDKVIICEDVTNNLSTTGKVVDLIIAAGATPFALATLLNRSTFVEKTFKHGDENIPVIPLVRLPYDEYKQDNPYVLADIEIGNVVWKPKNEWHTLPKV